MPRWTGTWTGGRTYQTNDGRTVWMIRKMRDKAQYQVTLDGVHSEVDAKAEFALFNADPAAYKPPAERRAEARQKLQVATLGVVVLDQSTVNRFLNYLADCDLDWVPELPEQQRPEGKKARTKKYRKNTRFYLDQWEKKLQSRDLRFIEPMEIKRIYGAWQTAKQKRAAAFKAFCSFLCDQGLLDPNQDPSRSLTVPQSSPEKAEREKGYEIAQVQNLYQSIKQQSIRDVLCMHAKTGMHGTEIDRLALGLGKITVLADREKFGEIAATIRFTHKTGRQHTISIDAQALAAAQRLQQRGRTPADRWVRRVVEKACKAMEVDPILFGELRHSFVAWSLEHGEQVSYSGKGVPLGVIASVLGHQTTRTTEKFYNVSKVPFMVKVPIKLEHPDDPATGSITQAAA